MGGGRGSDWGKGCGSCASRGAASRKEARGRKRVREWVGSMLQAVYTGLCALLYGKCLRGIRRAAFRSVDGSGCSLESEHETGGYME